MKKILWLIFCLSIPSAFADNNQPVVGLDFASQIPGSWVKIDKSDKNVPKDNFVFIEKELYKPGAFRASIVVTPIEPATSAPTELQFEDPKFCSETFTKMLLASIPAKIEQAKITQFKSVKTCEVVLGDGAARSARVVVLRGSDSHAWNVMLNYAPLDSGAVAAFQEFVDHWQKSKVEIKKAADLGLRMELEAQIPSFCEQMKACFTAPSEICRPDLKSVILPCWDKLQNFGSSAGDKQIAEFSACTDSGFAKIAQKKGLWQKSPRCDQVFAPDLAKKREHFFNQKTLQREAKECLAYASVAEAVYFKRKNEFTTNLKALAYAAKSKVYSLGFANGDADLQGGMTQAKFSELVKKHCPDCVSSATGFKVMAVGYLDDGKILDIWTVDQNRKLTPLVDGIASVVPGPGI